MYAFAVAVGRPVKLLLDLFLSCLFVKFFPHLFVDFEGFCRKDYVVEDGDIIFFKFNVTSSAKK